MDLRRTVLGAILAIAIGCGVDDEPDPVVEGTHTDSVDADRFALPPSAVAPRASPPGRSPDTVRPRARPPLPGGTRDDGARRLSPDELDVDAIVEAYRRYYVAEFYEQGSVVRDDVDPALVVHAKRRTALDWGYVNVEAWDALTEDMRARQRTRLNTEMARINRGLAVELHGAGPD